ncbi:hypothetical protein R1sor_018906 [Riccia sorocarpa]|uniref:Glycine-rich protein n=1 Tax=Riccia sorocarpa TaxID=122646 RepID=A0ABD3ICR4_9MARC
MLVPVDRKEYLMLFIDGQDEQIPLTHGRKGGRGCGDGEGGLGGGEVDGGGFGGGGGLSGGGDGGGGEGGGGLGDGGEGGGGLGSGEDDGGGGEGDGGLGGGELGGGGGEARHSRGVHPHKPGCGTGHEILFSLTASYARFTILPISKVKRVHQLM